VLEEYVPALVMGILGLGLGVALTQANRFLGPRRPNRVKREPYECGLPSDVRRSFRFGVSFYLVGILFILFDLEVVLLYPVAVAMGESAYALAVIAVFVFFLAVAFVYEWARGSLEWRD
jgi:NADH-quinone oxidoreductase subunit A